VRVLHTIETGAADSALTLFERAIDLLFLLREAPDGLTAPDIAERFDVSRSSAFRYLQVLKARGLVEPAGPPGRFRLGPAIGYLARGRVDEHALIDAARPLMRRLAEETGESVLLTRRQDDRVTVLTAIDSDRVIRASMAAAQDCPLHVGSFGKLHAAHLSDAELGRLVAAGALAGGTDPAGLRDALTAIRRRGYAQSEGEIETGMSSVSVPVAGADGSMLAALSVAGPVFRLPQSLVPDLVRRLQATAAAIAARLPSPPAPSVDEGRLSEASS